MILSAVTDWFGKFDTLDDICNVVYLKRTSGISTSELKSKIYDHPLEIDKYEE